MLQRAGRLLARIRGARPSAVAEPVPRRWADELADAGVTFGQWIAKRQSDSRLFVEISDPQVERLRQRDPRMTKTTIDAATRVLAHEFDMLGSGPYTPVDPDRATGDGGYRPIDWYLDPVSGLRFPRGIPIAQWNLEQMRPGRADIKLPWELARCQHWPLLGQAFRLTGEDRFAVEIARELRDFMEANPVGVGINWTCTMDVALRAANWALALGLVRSCASLTPAFWAEAYEALFDHGVFIEGHLENNYEVTSNHFLSNVVGLFYLAAVFGDLPRGAAWDRQCRSWLVQEIAVQVLPDGADYESSVPYHRLVTELFLGAARVAEHGGEPLPKALLHRVQSMVAFLETVLRPDGLMPQCGDADDGRLHVLSGYGSWKPQDARHVFGPAACIFGRAGWMRLADEWGEWECEWWGLDPVAVEPDRSGAAVSDGVRHFPQAGLTVIRRGRDYLLITNGIVGTGGFGNHKHNDLLGFEYHLNGEAVIVDPGSYVYTSDPEARNLFRSTASHNTVSVDGQEQNEFRPEWLFRMFEKASPEHLAVTERGDGVEYRGRHSGYTRLPEPVVHERTFTLSALDGTLRIADMLKGSGTHRLRWHFHFAPGLTVVDRSNGTFDIVAPRQLRLTVPPGLRATVAPAWYSPSYGVRTRCVALDLEVDARVDSSQTYQFEIAP
jgi:hypothetical protein